MGEGQAPHGPGDAHVGQPALLLQLGGLAQGPDVGEHPVLHAGQEHRRVLQALGRVQGHQRHLGVVVGQVVGVGHQSRPLDQLVDGVELAGHPDQLVQVLQAALGLDGSLRLQLGPVPRPVQDPGDDAGRAELEGRRLVDHRQEVADAGRGPARHPGLGAAAQRLGEGDPLGGGEGVEPGNRGVAHPPLGGVEHPLDAHLVGRVGHRLQVGDGVLDLPAVVEPDAAHELVGNPPVGQALLQRAGLGVGAVEDGQVAPAHLLGAVQVLEPVGHVAGLVGLVVGVVAGDLHPRAPLGPQLLGQPAGVLGDDGVGRVEDGLGAAVVLLQVHHGGVGEGGLELQDVAPVGPPEGVYGLVGVADHGHLPVLGRQQDHQVVLDPVGVLVLVHQDLGEPLPPAPEHVGMGPQQGHGVAEQVVEVHGPGGQQAPLVLAEHLGDAPLEDVGGPLGVAGRVGAVVLGRRDDGVDRAGREPLGIEVQVADHVVAEPDRVGLVVDREPGREPEPVGVAAQHPHAGAVERGHPHALGHRPDQAAHPLPHLGGRLVGEGDGQDVERRQTVAVDEVGDAVGQHPGLARSGPGHHQQGAADVGDGVALGRVQALQQGGCRRRVGRRL